MTQTLSDYIEAEKYKIAQNKFTNHFSDFVGEPIVDLENSWVEIKFKDVDGGDVQYSYQIQDDESLIWRRQSASHPA